MDKHIEYTYQPDYAVSPGEVLADELQARGISQQELAKRTGLTPKHIISIVKAKAAITPETAIKFERALGMMAEFWLNLEAHYQEVLARLDEQKKLEADVHWLEELPVNAMIRNGWIARHKRPKDQLIEILNFFGIANVKQWLDLWSFLAEENRERCIDASGAKATSAWLRRGEIEASWILCETYQRQQFRQTVREIRKQTVRGPEVFVPMMRELSAKSGVAVVFVPHLVKSDIHACTRWLNTSKAVIQLSLAHSTDDHIWLAFLHGAAHVLLHGKKDVFIEGINCVDLAKERSAHEFVEKEAIPEIAFSRFLTAGEFTKQSILSFAQEAEIAPGVVVGQLQERGKIPKSSFNELKEKYFPDLGTRKDSFSGNSATDSVDLHASY